MNAFQRFIAVLFAALCMAAGATALLAAVRALFAGNTAAAAVTIAATAATFVVDMATNVTSVATSAAVSAYSAIPVPVALVPAAAAASAETTAVAVATKLAVPTLAQLAPFVAMHFVGIEYIGAYGALLLAKATSILGGRPQSSLLALPAPPAAIEAKSATADISIGKWWQDTTVHYSAFNSTDATRPISSRRDLSSAFGSFVTRKTRYPALKAHVHLGFGEIAKPFLVSNVTIEAKPAVSGARQIQALPTAVAAHHVEQQLAFPTMPICKSAATTTTSFTSAMISRATHAASSLIVSGPLIDIPVARRHSHTQPKIYADAFTLIGSHARELELELATHALAVPEPLRVKVPSNIPQKVTISAAPVCKFTSATPLGTIPTCRAAHSARSLIVAGPLIDAQVDVVQYYPSAAAFYHDAAASFLANEFFQRNVESPVSNVAEMQLAFPVVAKQQPATILTAPICKSEVYTPLVISTSTCRASHAARSIMVVSASAMVTDVERYPGDAQLGLIIALCLVFLLDRLLRFLAPRNQPSTAVYRKIDRMTKDAIRALNLTPDPWGQIKHFADVFVPSPARSAFDFAGPRRGLDILDRASLASPAAVYYADFFDGASVLAISGYVYRAGASSSLAISSPSRHAADIHIIDSGSSSPAAVCPHTPIRSSSSSASVFGSACSTPFPTPRNLNSVTPTRSSNGAKTPSAAACERFNAFMMDQVTPCKTPIRRAFRVLADGRRVYQRVAFTAILPPRNQSPIADSERGRKPARGRRPAARC
ncbi:hypothetical protein H9P43_010149 [Blastocladiella emersonii ATCC 22665]|nr:hypothetical protein H9P43_010122 [Blastocladiella emersonii ATCC 22665]KAI9148551.1 hypothetical protein H9P43_010149 [Blastocladiella emersonii ATCC 22665]